MGGQVAEQGGQVIPPGLLAALQCWPPQVHRLQLCPAGDQGVLLQLLLQLTARSQKLASLPAKPQLHIARVFGRVLNSF